MCVFMNKQIYLNIFKFIFSKMDSLSNFISIVAYGSTDGVLTIPKKEKELKLVQAGNRRGSSSTKK